MSALVMLVAESRACLERIVCCSSMETSSLLVSCAFCRERTFVALTLFRTETSVLRLGLSGKRIILNVVDSVGALAALARIAPIISIAFWQRHRRARSWRHPIAIR